MKKCLSNISNHDSNMTFYFELNVQLGRWKLAVVDPCWVMSAGFPVIFYLTSATNNHMDYSMGKAGIKAVSTMTPNVVCYGHSLFYQYFKGFLPVLGLDLSARNPLIFINSSNEKLTDFLEEKNGRKHAHSTLKKLIYFSLSCSAICWGHLSKQKEGQINKVFIFEWRTIIF